MTVNWRQVTALTGTDPDYSVMSGLFLAQLRKVRTAWDGPQIRTAGGHLVTPTGGCTARVTLRGHVYPVSFVILRQRLREVVLGMDSLSENGAVIELKARSLMLTSGQSASSEGIGYQSAAATLLEDTVSIPPLASVLPSVETEEKAPGYAIVETNAQLLLH